MANGVDLPVALPAGDAPCPGLAARPHARAEDDRHASWGLTPRGGRSPAYRETLIKTKTDILPRINYAKHQAKISSASLKNNMGLHGFSVSLNADTWSLSLPLKILEDLSKPQVATALLRIKPVVVQVKQTLTLHLPGVAERCAKPAPATR